MQPFEPQIFGDYVLHDRIGAGGMAEIFLATSRGIEGFEKRLVIKRILPTLSDDEQFVRMFIEEAKLCVALRHPNIVQVYDLGEIDLQYFIAMEYVDGRDLLKTLAACGRQKIGFPTDIALYIVMEVLKGLDYAHKLTRPDGEPLGIIHRDVSPSNVLLSFEGEVKIGDFGIAKATTREKTATGILKGKFGYMAPEQVTGAEIDHKADIFAIGIVLYELLTGHRLFAGKNDLAVLERVRDAVIDPPPRFYRADLDPELESIVMRALSRDSKDRFATSQDLHDALHDYVYRSRALIGPAHLGRFMQSLFLSDPEELVRRNAVSLPLFGRGEETPQNGASPAELVFSAEATQDERSAVSQISGLIDNDGDFEEKTPLLDEHDALDPPTREQSSLNGQVAFIEDAASFERDVELMDDETTNGRPPLDDDDPTVDPQALILANGKPDPGPRTARTDVAPPAVEPYDEEELEVGSEAIVGFAVEPTAEDGAELESVQARAEVQAIRDQHEQDSPTDWELDKDPRFPRKATPTPLAEDATVDIDPVDTEERHSSAIDTELDASDDVRDAIDEASIESQRSFSPAEIVERTVSQVEPLDEDEADLLSSEIEPTVRFDSSMYPQLRDDTGGSTLPGNSDAVSIASRPVLTDDYPDHDDSGFGTIEEQESDLPTAEVPPEQLHELESALSTARAGSVEVATRPESVTDAVLQTPDPIVEPVASADEDPMAVTITGEDALDDDDDGDGELTAEIGDEVRLALANDFVSVIDTKTIEDEPAEEDETPAQGTAGETEPEPPAVARRPSRRRPITGRRPRPVLVPAADGDARDNLARRPSTRSILPRRQSPRRRVTTRAALSVVNPRADSTTNRDNELFETSDDTGEGALVDELTQSGALGDADPRDTVPTALPDRRNSSGITAALDEAAQIEDEIAEIRRTSSVATHEPTKLGPLADALEEPAQVPVIDFEADEPTQDGSNLQEAMRRRQSRKRMVTRSVVLYGEGDEPNPELHENFGDMESEMSVPAITSAGQLEDPDAVDLFGALSVLDEAGDELGFDEDDVSMETVSRAEARPAISIDDRQAIPVPPTQPTALPSERPAPRGSSQIDENEFTDAGPATTKGSVLPDDVDDDGYELSFHDDEEATASVTDGQVVSVSQLIGVPSNGKVPDVVELGGRDSLDAPNPSSVSISFGSMAMPSLEEDERPPDDGEYTTVNEEEEHIQEIAQLRSGGFDGIADEETEGEQSRRMAGLPPMEAIDEHTTNERGGGGGLLVSESFDFGVDQQEELRSRRPSPEPAPPPVRPVSMRAAPGGVDPEPDDPPLSEERPRGRNASALRAVVERQRAVKEKNRAKGTPGPKRSPMPANGAARAPMPATGTPLMRATGTSPVGARPAPATGSIGDAYPQIQVRRTSFWTTLMYVMVGIAVILAVAAAVSSILLKDRSAVPIAPLAANEDKPKEPKKKPADTPPAPPKKTAETPPPKKADTPPPPPAKAPAKAPAPPPPAPKKKTVEAPKKKAVAPPPPPPAPPPKKKVVKKRATPKRKRVVKKRVVPKKRVKKKKTKRASGNAKIVIACSEPTAVKISGANGKRFTGDTKLTKSVPPGSYRITFKRNGSRKVRNVNAIAGQTAEVPCP